MSTFGKCGRNALCGALVSLILFACLFGTLPFWGKGCGFGIMLREAVKSQLARKRLLCQTDYHALLASSRELLKRTAEGKLKPGVYKIARRPPSPDISQFPKLIVDLAPELVTIDETGYLTIEMRACGFDHCGATAYPKDFKPPHEGFKYGGQRMLIEGLWYYDDEYATDPAYDQVIDGLVKRGERHQSGGSAVR